MKRLVFGALLGGTLLGGPVNAENLDVPAGLDQSEFGKAVRTYLLNNPGVILEAFYLLEEQERAKAGSGEQELVARHATDLFEDPRDGRKGDPSGARVFVEFVDYNCGYCRNNAAEIDDFLTHNRDVTLVLKEFPILGQGSDLAARTALAVKTLFGNDAYVEFHKAMFEVKGQVGGPIIAGVLQRLGHDAEVVGRSAQSSQISAHLQETQALAKVLGISGTPGFVFPKGIHRGVIVQSQIADRLPSGPAEPVKPGN